MNRLRTGDDVIVIAGKDKGRRGTVLKVIDDGRVVVEGINTERPTIVDACNALLD